MTPQTFQRVRDLFVAALDIPAGLRADWLAEQCGEDSGLRAEIESLLEQAEPSSGGMTDPLTSSSAGATLEGQSFGGYRLIRVLGAGGMGIVYEAEQQHPKRPVALKLIRRLFVSPSSLRRFEHEADVLARLEHSGIARIYEAGTFEVGPHEPQPFFAMELVRGRPLDQYARENKLSTRTRLELLIKICQAVQHAHQKGVIHRDLKPGNILVTDDGQPKILDFGVARAIDSDMQSITRQTETGQLVGTLPYMSPEQVAGDLHEIDTRSDVYALGVIAFELLTERLPYSLAERSLPEAIRIIREEDASRLSSVDRSLRGDVETIVAKALEKEKDRRYGGAGEFSADIGRYLNYEPISARPPSAWYQLGKFARRNKVLVGGIGAVCLALLCGIIATSHQAIRAERQRQIAERALEESDQFIAMFIAGLIRQGNFDTAVEYQRNSWQSNTRSLGPDHKLTLKSQLSLADLVSRTDAPWALELVRDAAVRSTHAFGKDDTLTLRAGISLCNLLTNTGHLQEAAEVARDVWQRASRSGRTVEAIEAESMLAFALSKLGSDEAEGLLRNLVTDARRGTGPRSFYTLGAMNSFASYLLDHERWREALPVAQELYEAMCQSHSAPEGEVPGYIALYGIVLVKLERFADAEEPLLQAQQQYVKAGETSEARYSMLLNSLAQVYEATNRPTEAAKWRAMIPATKPSTSPASGG